MFQFVVVSGDFFVVVGVDVRVCMYAFMFTLQPLPRAIQVMYISEYAQGITINVKFRLA